MLDVAQHREITFVSIAMERWRSRTITGRILQSLVEKPNVKRLVLGDQTVPGVSRGHVGMAWPLSASVLQASLGTIVNKLLRRHQ